MIFDLDVIRKVYSDLPHKIEQVKNELKRPLTPVSYTHLDVYKRQYCV